MTLVHRLKFGRSWELAKIMAPFLFQAMTQVAESVAVPVDIIVPVPLHWRRRAKPRVQSVRGTGPRSRGDLAMEDRTVAAPHPRDT